MGLNIENSIRTLSFYGKCNSNNDTVSKIVLHYVLPLNPLALDSSISLECFPAFPNSPQMKSLPVPKSINNKFSIIGRYIPSLLNLSSFVLLSQVSPRNISFVVCQDLWPRMAMRSAQGALQKVIEFVPWNISRPTETTTRAIDQVLERNISAQGRNV